MGWVISCCKIWSFILDLLSLRCLLDTEVGCQELSGWIHGEHGCTIIPQLWKGRNSAEKSILRIHLGAQLWILTKAKLKLASLSFRVCVHFGIWKYSKLFYRKDCMIYIPISVYKSIYFTSLPKLNIVFLKFCNFTGQRLFTGFFTFELTCPLVSEALSSSGNVGLFPVLWRFAQWWCRSYLVAWGLIAWGLSSLEEDATYSALFKQLIKTNGETAK